MYTPRKNEKLFPVLTRLHDREKVSEWLEHSLLPQTSVVTDIDGTTPVTNTDNTSSAQSSLTLITDNDGTSLTTRVTKTDETPSAQYSLSLITDNDGTSPTTRVTKTDEVVSTVFFISRNGQ